MSDTWPTVQLGTLLTDIQPGFASGRHNSEGEGIPHFRPMNISTEGRIERGVIKYVDQSAGRHDVRLAPDDILFNNTNSPELVGKTALFDGDDSPAFSNHMTRLRVDPNRLDPRYTALRLHQAWREGWFAAHCNNHVSQASVGRDVLKGFEIELPPLDVQRAIASFSDAIDDSRSSASAHLLAAQTAIVRFRQAVLAAACSGRLTADWREHNPDVESAEKLVAQSACSIAEPEEGLAELPDKWAWVALGNYARCSRGRFSVRPRNDPSCFGGEHPFIQIGNLNPDGGWVRSHMQTLNAKGLSVSKKFPKGTAVIAIVGATIGNTGLLAYDMCFPDSLVGLETGTPEGNRYVELFLRDRKHAIRQASYSSGGQPNIKLESLNPYPLALPPLAEQREIVHRVDGLLHLADGLQDRIDAASKCADRSSQAVLAKAFRGELVTPGEGVDGE